MSQKSIRNLYLLDGMALIYRAFFAFQNNPIRNSRGENNSALFGFLNTLMDIIQNRKPTHIAVAFDTMAPTFRHEVFPEYKAQREEIPEDLASALPRARELLDALRIPVLELDGYEADDIIGTLAARARDQGYQVYMVTPDKDFAQLVEEKVLLYRPGRKGSEVEILGPSEVCEKWEIASPSLIRDILGLWGDSSDNIPGVPGIGQKTAAKLIARFGSIDGILENLDQLKGRQKENLEEFGKQALLSRDLATINTNVPAEWDLDSFVLEDYDEPALRKFLVDHEFNAIGRRIFGEDFKAGRGFQSGDSAQGDLFANLPVNDGESDADAADAPQLAPQASLKTIADTAHEYRLATTIEELRDTIEYLSHFRVICFDTETTTLDPLGTDLLGIAWAVEEGRGGYIALPSGKTSATERRQWIDELAQFFASEQIEWVGHHLKFDLHVLETHGIHPRGRFFDTMIAHCLLDPDQRHGMDFLSETFLGYTPIPITSLIGEDKKNQKSMAEVPLGRVAEYAAEDADVTLRLFHVFRNLLTERGIEKVFYDIEMPLLPVLVSMERIGVALDAAALSEVSSGMERVIARLEKSIHKKAGREFNLNSPRQLGVVLFEDLKIVDKPKKTRTGQYATNEQVLLSLASTHSIIGDILEYRGLTKLKSTYIDALPSHVRSDTGRIHTTFGQVLTATGRLQSQDPNLQNIPIRSDEGREIRRAFIAAPEGGYLLLAADYSQVELRIIAALSRDQGMLDFFAQGLDIHAATASRVYNVPVEDVTSAMRRSAKMVNFGIAYGMTAFGLSQRLGIPRAEAKSIIEHYYQQFPGIRSYLDSSIEFARTHGYVETLCGRRRVIPDINSSNATIRAAAERNAINMPIQGTAADMIKIAMASIHSDLLERKFKSRLILQVHDELLFEAAESEIQELKDLIIHHMTHAIQLDVPIEVEIGTGANWLEAH